MQFVHNLSTAGLCYFCSRLLWGRTGVGGSSWPKSSVSPSLRRNRATQALPQNVEAEAALLGALMIDNRLVEDVQLKLRPHHFFEPLHGRIYEAILRLTDSNRVANPVTLRPLFEADEAIKEVGGAAYLAQLTGSGAAVIGARDFAEQIYDLALLRALIGVGRDLVEGALDTSEDVAPLAQIERAETELYKVAEEGGRRGQGQDLRRGHQGSARNGRSARSTAAAICPASPPASTA